MTSPYYMTEKLKLTEELKSRFKARDVEMTLIHRLMNKNGWDFPTPGGQHEDPDGRLLDAPSQGYQTEYDMAVEEVKWFIEQLVSLSD